MFVSIAKDESADGWVCTSIKIIRSGLSNVQTSNLYRLELLVEASVLLRHFPFLSFTWISTRLKKNKTVFTQTVQGNNKGLGYLRETAEKVVLALIGSWYKPSGFDDKNMVNNLLDSVRMACLCLVFWLGRMHMFACVTPSLNSFRETLRDIKKNENMESGITKLGDGVWNFGPRNKGTFTRCWWRWSTTSKQPSRPIHFTFNTRLDNGTKHKNKLVSLHFHKLKTSKKVIAQFWE